MKGIRSYEPKERRKVRRRNHIARDLMSPKYNQRIREVDHKEDTSWRADLDDYYNKEDNE